LRRYTWVVDVLEEGTVNAAKKYAEEINKEKAEQSARWGGAG